MASIRKEITLSSPAADVWDALSDFGAVASRVAPGFALSSRLEGNVRIVKFANGAEAAETLVSRDDQKRRLVYAIVGGRIAHYNAAIQVIPERDGCALVWTIDLLPDDFAGYIEAQMDAALIAMKRTLEKVS